MFAIDGVKLPSNASKAKGGSPEGKSWYGRRFATVEPVFVNLRQQPVQIVARFAITI